MLAQRLLHRVPLVQAKQALFIQLAKTSVNTQSNNNNTKHLQEINYFIIVGVEVSIVVVQDALESALVFAQLLHALLMGDAVRRGGGGTRSRRRRRRRCCHVVHSDHTATASMMSVRRRRRTSSSNSSSSNMATTASCSHASVVCHVHRRNRNSKAEAVSGRRHVAAGSCKFGSCRCDCVASVGNASRRRECAVQWHAAQLNQRLTINWRLKEAILK